MLRQAVVPYALAESGAPVRVVTTSWRDILETMRLTLHHRNIATYASALQDLQAADIRAHPDPWGLGEERDAGDGAPHPAAPFEPVISDIWIRGHRLDDRVGVMFGPAVDRAYREHRLASLPALPAFRLKAGRQRMLWAFLMSFDKFFFLREEKIAACWDVDLDDADWRKWQKFRLSIRRSFNDMTAVGGIRNWHGEPDGSDGRRRLMKYVFSRF